MNDLQSATEACLSRSRRWFPELHARGTLAVAVHFALGMAGEIGELVEHLDAHSPEVWRSRSTLIGDEGADVAIYALDLAGTLHCPIEVITIFDVADFLKVQPLVVCAMRVVDLVKKINRSTDPWAEMDRRRADLTRGLAEVLARVEAILDFANVEIADAIELKAEVCEGRWGTAA